ncbi:MAG TPA: CoA-transferase [Methylomirabilota bacterium]|nr:CoA-transferase [Methylomirabilota bacterium]
MTAKLRSLGEAAARVPDGGRLAIGGFAVYQHPMAFVRELVRQGRRDLTVVGSVNGNDVDLLAGAGSLRRVESSYVGLEKYGLAPNFRRRVERGELEMVDYPELLSFDRFRASQDRLTFWACDYLGGTDIPTYNEEIREFPCPLTGRRLHAVPPADPEITVIHAVAADERGNVVVPPRRLLPQSLDLTMARAARAVIVTAEEIVSREYIRRHARWVGLPSYCVTHVVEAPWGAHPCPVLGRYGIDDAHFREYAAAGASAEAFAAYLARYVTGPVDHAAYLDLIGRDRLADLREVAAP